MLVLRSDSYRAHRVPCAEIVIAIAIGRSQSSSRGHKQAHRDTSLPACALLTVVMGATLLCAQSQLNPECWVHMAFVANGDHCLNSPSTVDARDHVHCQDRRMTPGPGLQLLACARLQAACELSGSFLELMAHGWVPDGNNHGTIGQHSLSAARQCPKPWQCGVLVLPYDTQPYPVLDSMRGTSALGIQ